MKSPCVRICVVHLGTGYCVGCQRTVEEIADWVRMTDEERARIMEALPHREQAHRGRHVRPSRRRRQNDPER